MVEIPPNEFVVDVLSTVAIRSLETQTLQRDSEEIQIRRVLEVGLQTALEKGFSVFGAYNVLRNFRKLRHKKKRTNGFVSLFYFKKRFFVTKFEKFTKNFNDLKNIGKYFKNC